MCRSGCIGYLPLPLSYGNLNLVKLNLTATDLTWVGHHCGRAPQDPEFDSNWIQQKFFFCFFFLFRILVWKLWWWQRRRDTMLAEALGILWFLIWFVSVIFKNISLKWWRQRWQTQCWVKPWGAECIGLLQLSPSSSLCCLPHQKAMDINIHIHININININLNININIIVALLCINLSLKVACLEVKISQGLRRFQIPPGLLYNPLS